MALYMENIKVLVVGLDPLGAECLKKLIEAGVRHFSILSDRTLDYPSLSDNPWLSSATAGEPVAKAIASWLAHQNNSLTLETRVEDPLKLVQESPDYIRSFPLVITLDLDRDIELVLGKALFEDPSCTLIVSRSNEFHAKVRSQYRTYTYHDAVSSKVELRGVELSQRPEPPTAEKCERVRKALARQVDLSSPGILSYLLIIYATGNVFKTVQGYPPAHRPAPVSLSGHEDAVEEVIRKTIADKHLEEATIDLKAIKICCAQGWGALPLTATVMGALTAGEAITLLTHSGPPVNTAPLDLAAAAALGIGVQM